MEEYNWLYHYKNREGIEKSIRGICKRHPVLGEADPALDIFESRFHDLKAIYQDFFPELHEEVRKKFLTQ
jgi:acyl carrier protein phosphodiesterase